MSRKNDSTRYLTEMLESLFDAMTAVDMTQVVVIVAIVEVNNCFYCTLYKLILTLYRF